MKKDKAAEFLVKTIWNELMKNNGRIIVSVLVIAVFFAFLGIPVPDWLSGFVNSLAGTISAIIAGFSKLVAFIQIFVHF